MASLWTWPFSRASCLGSSPRAGSAAGPARVGAEPGSARLPGRRPRAEPGTGAMDPIWPCTGARAGAAEAGGDAGALGPVPRCRRAALPPALGKAELPTVAEGRRAAAAARARGLCSGRFGWVCGRRHLQPLPRGGLRHPALGCSSCLQLVNPFNPEETPQRLQVLPGLQFGMLPTVRSSVHTHSPGCRALAAGGRGTAAATSAPGAVQPDALAC